jgi:hypothetical protein
MKDIEADEVGDRRKGVEAEPESIAKVFKKEKGRYEEKE